jgi:hypothetical protein
VDTQGLNKKEFLDDETKPGRTEVERMEMEKTEV